MQLGSLKPARGFFAVPLATADGYTYTLTSLLGLLLHQAQERYGSRDQSYTPLGVEFGEDGAMVWYPATRRYVSIMLSAEAADDPARALFQLAHEAVHLLAPTGSRNAPLVEEGLASIFADDVSAEFSLGYHTDGPAYVEAAAEVRRWLELFPDAIKKTRSIEPSFAAWTPETLTSACSGTPTSLAVRLCEPFAALR